MDETAGRYILPAYRPPHTKVIAIDRKTLLLFALIIVIITVAAFVGYTIIHQNTPVRIGVLLPVSGDIEIQEPLEWAKDTINIQGGIGGRPVELVYRDTGAGNTTQLAEELLADDSIRIVIGPPTSDDVFTLAPEFIRQQKLLISPLATSGDIIRAFGKKGYFWRTPQGDVAQVKTLLAILKSDGVSRIALLTENSTYGRTFYEWTGFFATEYGIDLAYVSEFEPDSSTLVAAVEEALTCDPDYVIAASGPSDAAVMRRVIDRSGKKTKLFLADAAVSPALISSLGPLAEGIEGTSPTADPTTGFNEVYREKFGHDPTDYAAPAYDAVLLAAYASARQDAVLFESPADSMRTVVYGNGTARGWDAAWSREAIADIRNGKTPAISGASGPLDYDKEFGVDPLVTWYSHWVIKDGNFRTLTALSSAKTGIPATSGESVARSRASDDHRSVLLNGTGQRVSLPAKTGFMAVVAGPSKGWSNYRHQSDALAVYTLLRENGVDDDHIILMVYDDIPYSPQNPIRGDVHNTLKGQNLRTGAVIDYSGARVTAETFRNVLAGNRTEESPVVLESNAGTDVFIFIASHGSPGNILFGLRDDAFTSSDFANVTDNMNRDRRYRQMVFFVDTCFGESIAADASADGILFLTGAARNEPSLGAVYDMNIKQWLSDEFTASVINLVRSNPQITFRELYAAAYEKVTGSHVRMITTGNVSIDTPVMHYIRP